MRIRIYFSGERQKYCEQYFDIHDKEIDRTVDPMGEYMMLECREFGEIISKRNYQYGSEASYYAVLSEKLQGVYEDIATEFSDDTKHMETLLVAKIMSILKKKKPDIKMSDALGASEARIHCEMFVYDMDGCGKWLKINHFTERSPFVAIIASDKGEKVEDYIKSFACEILLPKFCKMPTEKIERFKTRLNAAINHYHRMEFVKSFKKKLQVGECPSLLDCSAFAVDKYLKTAEDAVELSYLELIPDAGRKYYPDKETHQRIYLTDHLVQYWIPDFRWEKDEKQSVEGDKKVLCASIIDKRKRKIQECDDKETPSKKIQIVEVVPGTGAALSHDKGPK